MRSASAFRGRSLSSAATGRGAAGRCSAIGRFLSGSIGAAGHWCFRWCRAARASAGRRSRPQSGRCARCVMVKHLVALVPGQVRRKHAGRGEDSAIEGVSTAGRSSRRESEAGSVTRVFRSTSVAMASRRPAPDDQVTLPVADLPATSTAAGRSMDRLHGRRIAWGRRPGRRGPACADSPASAKRCRHRQRHAAVEGLVDGLSACMPRGPSRQRRRSHRLI